MTPAPAWARGRWRKLGAADERHAHRRTQPELPQRGEDLGIRRRRDQVPLLAFRAVLLEVGLLPAADLEQPRGLGLGHVDALTFESREVGPAMSRIDHVKCPIASLEPILDEGHQHPILLCLRVKERADVARPIED